MSILLRLDQPVKGCLPTFGRAALSSAPGGDDGGRHDHELRGLRVVRGQHATDAILASDDALACAAGGRTSPPPQAQVPGEGPRWQLTRSSPTSGCTTTSGTPTPTTSSSRTCTPRQT